MGGMIKKIMKNNAWDIGISPLFTVITPVYNRKILFKRTMESVARQTLKNFEYIVIDDGSQEKESIDDIMEEFMEWADFPIMYIKKENGGYILQEILVRNMAGESCGV